MKFAASFTINKIAVLNRLVPASSLLPGVNTLEIVPGADRKQRDDFELQRAVVSNRVPPV